MFSDFWNFKKTLKTCIFICKVRKWLTSVAFPFNTRTLSELIIFLISLHKCISLFLSKVRNRQLVNEKFKHKKVLLRERKRHTARRVVSTPSVVLTGYPPTGSPPSWPGQGGYPTWVPPSGVPPPRLDLAGYPPRCLPHGILGNVAKHYGIWVPPPQGVNRLKTLPSPSFGCGR